MVSVPKKEIVTDDIRELLPLTIAFDRIERLMVLRADLFSPAGAGQLGDQSETISAILALPERERMSDEQLIAFLTARKMSQ